MARITRHREQREMNLFRISCMLRSVSLAVSSPAANTGWIKKNPTITISTTILIVVGLNNVLKIFLMLI